MSRESRGQGRKHSGRRPLWNTRDTAIVEAIANSSTWEQAVKSLGYAPQPTQVAGLRRRASWLKLDVSHLTNTRKLKEIPEHMMHPREGSIVDISDADFIEIAAQVYGFVNFGDAIGYPRNARRGAALTYAVRNRAKMLGVSLEHFHRSGMRTGPGKIKGEAYLRRNVNHTTQGRRHVKRALLRDGILKEECGKCGMGPEWQGEELSLTIHHKNNDIQDFRLENITLLCPNCYSQETRRWRAARALRMSQDRLKRNEEQRYRELLAEGKT